MEWKKSDKYLIASVLIIGGLWLALFLIQRKAPPPTIPFSTALLRPLDPQLDSDVLKIIKKHRGL